jgi:hypothetical protein
MRSILALATGALLSTTASSFAAVVTYPNPGDGGKTTCTESLSTSSNSADSIQGAAVSNHILVGTVTAAGDPCNTGATASYGQGFVGKLTPAAGVTKNGAIVAGYSSSYHVSYITVISWPLPAVGKTGTFDTYLNACELGGKNCGTLTYAGSTIYTRTK